jgi:hypothetical protein
MQGLGVTSALAPVLDALDADEAERRAFLTRQLRFFNTNPLLHGFLIGALLRLEWNRARTGSPSPVHLERIRGALGGALGGFGDRVLLGTMQPLALTVALMCAISGSYAGMALVLAAAFGLTVVLRAWGFYRGARSEPGATGVLPNLPLLGLPRFVRAPSAFLAGLFAAFSISGGASGPWAVSWVLPFLLGGAFLAVRKAVPSSVIAVGVFLISLLLSYLP